MFYILFQAYNGGPQWGSCSDYKFKSSFLPKSLDETNCRCSTYREVGSHVLQRLVLCPRPSRHCQSIKHLCWAWLCVTTLFHMVLLAATTNWSVFPCEMNPLTPETGKKLSWEGLQGTNYSGCKQCKTFFRNMRDFYQQLL